MSTITDDSAATVKLNAAPDHERKYLVGPLADGLLLGGGSVPVLILVAYLWPTGSDTAFLATTTLLLANLINHPHFAHSYQLFYRDFHARCFGDRFPPGLRLRYLIAAVIVPLVLILFFSYCLITHDALLLGRSANLMFFLVGWHYVKQGYGMLMVDTILKRNFFGEHQKKHLLWNAYSVWICSYLLANRILEEKNFWQLKYYAFGVPDWLLWGSFAAVAFTSALAGIVIFPKLTNWRIQSPPINGVVAYVVSLYAWLLIRHPAMLLVIPAFHSLQYLAVVWRYRLNIEKDMVRTKTGLFVGRGPWPGFFLFIFTGSVMGYLGFWMIPSLMGSHIGYDREVFGGALFLFLSWIFINVHHYFLDNVMWRKDNPDTRKYLFGSS